MDRFEAARRRRTLREEAVAYKGGRCEICGYDRSPAAMDFHHVDPWAKDFTISQRMTSFRAIRRELDKCVLLCATCHREVHDGLHPTYLEDHERFRSHLDGDEWEPGPDLTPWSDPKEPSEVLGHEDHKDEDPYDPEEVVRGLGLTL